MEDKIKFGQFIAQKRKEQNLTQRELAAILYVTESVVSKWERGLSYPDISLVTKICETLKITEHELITASDDYKQRQFEEQALKYSKIYRIYNCVLLGGFGLSLIVCFLVNIMVLHKLSWFFVVLAAEMTAISFLNVPVLVSNKNGIWTIITSLLSISSLLVVCNFLARGNWIWVALIGLWIGYLIAFLPYVLREMLKPIGVGNNKALLCMVVDTIMIYLLVIVCSLHTKVGTNDLFSVAIPICTISMILPWVFMVIIRYLKLNGYLKTAACLGAGAVYIVFSNS